MQLFYVCLAKCRILYNKDVFSKNGLLGDPNSFHMLVWGFYELYHSTLFKIIMWRFGRLASWFRNNNCNSFFKKGRWLRFGNANLRLFYYIFRKFDVLSLGELKLKILYYNLYTICHTNLYFQIRVLKKIWWISTKKNL